MKPKGASKCNPQAEENLQRREEKCTHTIQNYVYEIIKIQTNQRESSWANNKMKHFTDEQT